MRWRPLSVFVFALLPSGPANGAESAGAARDMMPAAGLGSSGREPIRERSVAAKPRVTLETKAEDRARSERRAEVALQIPLALQKRALGKVEARITRNLERSRVLRREALGLLRALLADLPEEASEMPPTLMRLGELEWEESREAFLDDFARWERTPTDQRKDPPSPDYAQSRARFQRVIDRHPGYARLDLALYVDGFLATEEGRSDQALERFNRILSDHPGSPFVPDAHMVRAEVEFSRPAPDYQFAFAEYEAVLAHPGTELYDLALFKSAWALWRLGQTDEAARRFLTVFKASAERTSNAPTQRKQELDQLQAEALKNLVAVFVEDEKNTADDMYGFLVKAGGQRFAGEIVKALAEALYDQAHYTRGIEAYRLLIRLDPTAASAYEHALAIALGHSTLEMWDELRADYAGLLDVYVSKPASKPLPGAAPKVQATEKTSGQTAQGTWLALQDPATSGRATDSIEQHLFEDALGLHAKAQADKSSRVEFEAAAALYALYLTRFSERPRAYEAYFNVGEIQHHHLHDPLLAADAYLAAVRARPAGVWSRDALYNALSALESARQAEFEAAKAAAEKARESATDKKLTEAMELYSSTYPNDAALPELLFRQGRLYYDYGVYDVAVRQWGLLLERHAQSNQARAAGELILDSFNKSEDYTNIETWGRRLLQAPAFGTRDSQQGLKNLIVQAIFKQGEQLSKQGQHADSADAYLRAAHEFPGDERAAQAAVNAALEAERAIDLPKLRDAAALLIEHETARPEAARGVWVAASLYQSLGLLEEAAGYHEALALHWPKDEHNEDAAYNAVLLRTSLGERDRAIAAGKSFQSRYPAGPSSDEVTFLMGKAHEQAEDWRSAQALYARYANLAKLPSRRVEALARLAAACIELNDDKGAREALERAVQQHKQFSRTLDERGKYFGAKAHFMQAERVLAEFQQIRIEGDVKLLGQRLKRKADLLKRASLAFLETAKLGVADWTTASLYEVGAIYESFAQALMNSPPPPALSPEQAEEYRTQIDEFVVPIEEKSIEAYESGWLKALDLGIFNAWTAKMREALGRLNTEMYPPLSEVGFRLRSEGSARLPDLIPATRRSEAGKSLEFLIVPPGKAAPEVPETGRARPGEQRVSRAESR
jgi:TolA-binding protein